MKKIIILISIIILVLFLSTSTHQNNGIDYYYFVIALGLDILEDDSLKITVQLSTTKDDSSSSSGSSQSSNNETFSVEAKTINEGLTVLNNYLNKKINLSHCSAVIISEELAKKGFKKEFNTLSNDTELRHSCLLIVTSGKSEEMIKNVSNSGEAFSSRLYEHFLSSIDYTGFGYKSTFGTFFESFNNSSIEPVALYVAQSGDIIQTTGLAIFKNDKMQGTVDINNSIAHLILTNNLKQCIIKINDPINENEIIDLELSLYKKTSFDIDVIKSTPCIISRIYPEGRIISSGSTFNYTSKNNIKKIESITNTFLTNLINNYISIISKEYNSDTVGFGGIYRSKFLTEYDFNKIKWKENFNKSIFDTKVESKINSSNLFNED